MPTDFSDTLVIGISATALFDLSEADTAFRQRYAENRDTAVSEYRKYMLEREDDPLEPGTGMPLVQALLVY
jgi:5'-nucleotidase